MPRRQDVKDLVDWLGEFVSRGADFYSRAEVGLGLQRIEDGYQAVIGRLQVVPRLDTGTEEATLDYNRIVITNVHLPIERFHSTLEEVVLGDGFEHPEFGIIPLAGEVEATDNIHKQRKESRAHYGYVSSHWPYYYLSRRLRVEPPPPEGPLLKEGLPLFPNWYTAAHHFLDIGSRADTISGTHILVVTVPDPRARIERLMLEGATMNLLLGEGELRPNDLLIKAFASDEERVEADVEIVPEGRQIEWTFELEPENLSVHLLDRKRGEALDSRDFYLGWGYLPPGVVIERSESGLLEIMRRGEGPNVEFKEWAPQNPNFARIVCRALSAFANTSGGVLFLGVNDEGAAVGSVGLEESSRIEDYVKTHLDPPVDSLEFRSLEVNEAKVLAVLVEESSERPHVLRDQGTFVRHGASNMQATHAELVRLVKGEEQPSGWDSAYMSSLYR